MKDNGIDVECEIELLGIDERFNQLESYKNVSDMSNYASLVHAIKSDSKYLGFTKLDEISYDHELKSKDSDISYINSHYVELIKVLNRIVKIIFKYDRK